MNEPARFKIDENCPAEFVVMLRERGHDACHALDQGLGGRDDERIAAVCRSEQRAIVTMDVGFADIRRHPPRDYSGIVVLRVSDQHKGRVVSVFAMALVMFETEPLAGWLWIVEEAGVRFRAG